MPQIIQKKRKINSNEQKLVAPTKHYLHVLPLFSIQ